MLMAAAGRKKSRSCESVYIARALSIYSAFVTKRLIDIDDALLEQARLVTGASLFIDGGQTIWGA